METLEKKIVSVEGNSATVETRIDGVLSEMTTIDLSKSKNHGFDIKSIEYIKN